MDFKWESTELGHKASSNRFKCVETSLKKKEINLNGFTFFQNKTGFVFQVLPHLWHFPDYRLKWLVWAFLKTLAWLRTDNTSGLKRYSIDTDLAALRYMRRSQSLTPGVHMSSSFSVWVCRVGAGHGCNSGSLACSATKEQTKTSKHSLEHLKDKQPNALLRFMLHKVPLLSKILADVFF